MFAIHPLHLQHFAAIELSRQLPFIHPIICMGEPIAGIPAVLGKIGDTRADPDILAASPADQRAAHLNLLFQAPPAGSYHHKFITAHAAHTVRGMESENHSGRSTDELYQYSRLAEGSEGFQYRKERVRLRTSQCLRFRRLTSGSRNLRD
jgi:hypothetical protein